MINESPDIVVVGGGVAGFAAAMAAAENKRVLLIDRSPGIGGATTLTNVGTLCGLYYRSSSPVLIPHQFCHHLADEIFRHDDQARIVSLADGLHVISYEWSNLQNLFLNQLGSRGVELILDTHITGVQASSNNVSHLITKHNNKEKIIAGRAFIDCSGNGFITKYLGQDMISDRSYQSASQVMRFGNVNSENEVSLNFALKKVMVQNAPHHAWPSSYKSLSVIPGSLRNRQADLKLPLSTTITDHEDAAATLRAEVEELLPGLISVLRQVESLNDAVLEKVFPLPGIRLQQRPRGKYILTETDVRSCAKTKTGIALGTWPMEEWDYHGKVKLEYFREGDAYTIPAESLMSPVFENLFFAGKCISADTRAIASARVTGTCLQTGYAAGRLATAQTNIDRAEAIRKINNMITSSA